MMIETNAEKTMFNLRGATMSYVITLFQKAIPGLYHWGLAIRTAGVLPLPVEPQGFSVTNSIPGADGKPGPDYHATRLCQEYPGALAGDYRSPAWLALDSRGRPAMDLALRSCRVYSGRPCIEGLPFARTGKSPSVQSLELVLADPVTGLAAYLNYTLFPECDTLVRSTRLCNEGKDNITISKASSFSLDLPVDAVAAMSAGASNPGTLGGAGPQSGFELISFDGVWARERHLSRTRLGNGRTVLGSRRGVSSHHLSPSAALVRTETTERQGEAYAFSLIYSGDWEMSAERNEEGSWRVQGGLNPELWSSCLEPGSSFQTPEAVLCFAPDGIGGLSDRLHRFVRDHIIPESWAVRERPILINNWEATYFDFDTDKLLAIAKKAADTGVELFVLDDGWFGERNSDRAGLGDWYVNEKKLPGGLKRLSDGVHALGMRFGLWFEPEMVSPDSALYRAHPDWCLHLEGRDRSPGRNQLVLDLTRPEVRAEILRRVREVLSSVQIDYVKWDMNRPLSHAGSAGKDGRFGQGELRHRQVLGVYAMMRELTEAFPDILFEGCSGGGGRMDYGILHYMPQYWASDNTDALARLGIQYSTSVFFPPLVMGCHVSAVPNHQTGRVLPLRSRGFVAMGGNLGYELDVTKMRERETERMAADIAWYKANRAIVQFGRFFRLASPWDGNEAAWLFMAPDGSRAILFWFRLLAEANPGCVRLRLDGLAAEADYRIAAISHTMEDSFEPESKEQARMNLALRDMGLGKVIAGSELLHRGLVFRVPDGDCAGFRVELVRES